MCHSLLVSTTLRAPQKVALCVLISFRTRPPSSCSFFTLSFSSTEATRQIFRVQAHHSHVHLHFVLVLGRFLFSSCRFSLTLTVSVRKVSFFSRFGLLRFTNIKHALTHTGKLARDTFTSARSETRHSGSPFRSPHSLFRRVPAAE